MTQEIPVEPVHPADDASRLAKAPTELDWCSLPHLLAKAQPLQREANERLMDWHRMRRRRRGYAATPSQALTKRAERDIAAMIKEDQASAEAALSLLHERCVQSGTPVPEDLARWVQMHRTKAQWIEFLLTLGSFAGLPGPQAKPARRGPKVKNAARDCRIVIRILLYTRLYRRKPDSGGTLFQGACEKTAKRFGLSAERVRSIYRLSTIADRAQISMRMLNKQLIRDAQLQKEK